MKPLLILPSRHRSDDADIWRAAVRQGWETFRANSDLSEVVLIGRPRIRYYGNTLHAMQIGSQLPITFPPIPLTALTLLTDITKRSVHLTTFADISATRSMPRFIKPVGEKWFRAGVYGAEERLPEGPLPSDPVYVQDVVDFVHEVRCFVLHSAILTASLYRYERIAWDMCGLAPDELNFDERIEDTEIPRLVREIRSRFGDNLPKGIVADFGRLPSGEWALIEFNEAWASGVYHCRPELCLEVIVASQFDVSNNAK